MNAETPFPIRQRSRIRTKTLTSVDLVLNDGTRLAGDLYIGVGQRVLDMLNAAPALMPFRTIDEGVLLIAKSSIAICQPVGELTVSNFIPSPEDALPEEAEPSD